ncbi:peptidoglycan-binding protein [Streptomyces sp. NPDC057592]|uniref:peptidoglycan-binding protein n=1 Tax=unclassified Streptomyces TaxID=2593676 RepID=UPI0036C5EA61
MRPDQGDNPPAQPLPEVTALLQALRQVKASKNLSLDAFTHDTGYSRSSWNRVLKGTAFPPRTAVERLCSRRGLDKEKLLGLWDTADQARRAQDAQQEAPPGTAPVPAPATPAPGVPDPTPPTTPDPVPPTAAPDPAPSAAADPVPGTAAPKPAAASPAPAPPMPGPAEPAKPAAAPRSRIKILALTAAVLAALLLVGRWYSTYETENPTTIEVGGDNRPDDDQPGDDQPVVDETPLPPKSSTAPTKAPKDDEKKDKDQDSAGEEDTNTKTSSPSSPAKGETSSSPSAPVSPSTAASPGAAGRASCRYNWDRTQVMAKGMVGSKVKQIQCLLNSNYDYTLTVDGKFGESTDVAVRAVQSCSGLKPDGQVGSQTWKYLDTPMSGCGH